MTSSQEYRRLANGFLHEACEVFGYCADEALRDRLAARLETGDPETAVREFLAAEGVAIERYAHHLRDLTLMLKRRVARATE